MLGDVGDGSLNNLSGAVFQFAKDQRVGEGVGEALVVDLRAVNSKGSSSFVFVVGNCFRKELFESNDVLVGDVVLE